MTDVMKLGPGGTAPCVRARHPLNRVVRVKIGLFFEHQVPRPWSDGHVYPFQVRLLIVTVVPVRVHLGL